MEEGPIVVITVRQVAEWVRGEVLGDGELAISHARSLVDAQPGDITFVEDEKRLGEWYKSKASAAIVPLSVPVNGRPLIRVADPLMAFVNVYQQLRSRPVPHTGSVDPSAHVHPTVSLEPGVTIGAGVVVGEGTEIGTGSIIQANSVVGRFCKIGQDVNLYPHVVVYDDSVIGDRTIIHSNSVIGADGLGYRMQGGKHVKVPQLGWVEIASDVEIGACTTVDRGTFGPTRIGHGTKIDNLVQIAHNCQIGRHNIIASQVGIAGSATTGDYVVMAGQSGVADHLHVGDRAIVGARAGACKDIPPDCTTLGMPAIPSREFWRRTFSLAKLPDLIKEVDRIKNHLGMEDA